MQPLNYHHLRYFWSVAREGGVTPASRKLQVSQPAISTQVRELEQALGERLFERAGRRLKLTDAGRLVFRYADAIFGLGQELLDAVRDRPSGRPMRLAVGVADVVPKLVAHRLLAPALRARDGVHVVCHEDKLDRLLAELALHNLDVVIADSPVGPARVRAFSHLLGESGVDLFGAPALARSHRKTFPESLAGAPLLVPTENTALRRSLDAWFDARGLRPRVVGEFEDSALMKVFGQAGTGLFPAASVLAKDLKRQYGVTAVGHIAGVRERFYALTVERRLKHPAVLALSQAARRDLFG